MEYDYELGDKVHIGKRVAGDEKGVVTGRAEYSDRPPSYHVSYIDGNGCYRADWFNSPDLSPDSE